MTAIPPAGVKSVVLIERFDNVIHIDFCTSSPPPELVREDVWWSRAAGVGVEAAPGKTLATTGPLPARWSPRPLRVAGRRLARSQFAADLRDYRFVVGLLLAGLLCVAVFDDQIADLAHHLTHGGIR